MTAVPERTSARLGSEATSDESAWQTIRRGLALTPDALRGIWIALLLAVIATTGKIVVPISVQAILDRGAEKASAIAEATLREVYDKIGFI